MIDLLPLVIGVAVIGFYAEYLLRKQRKARSTWRFRASGIYSSATYCTTHGNHRIGAMVHHRTPYDYHSTQIQFTDGRTVIGNNLINIIYPSGTRIQVFENGLGEIKISEQK